MRAMFNVPWYLFCVGSGLGLRTYDIYEHVYQVLYLVACLRFQEDLTFSNGGPVRREAAETNDRHACRENICVCMRLVYRTYALHLFGVYEKECSMLCALCYNEVHEQRRQQRYVDNAAPAVCFLVRRAQTTRFVPCCCG